MNPETPEDILRGWMGEGIASLARFETYEEWQRVRLSTRWADYTITYSHEGRSFLMASASGRVIRPGETWQRGNDLPDGPFMKETWDSIMTAIVSYELIAIPEAEVGVAPPAEVPQGTPCSGA